MGACAAWILLRGYSKPEVHRISTIEGSGVTKQRAFPPHYYGDHTSHFELWICSLEPELVAELQEILSAGPLLRARRFGNVLTCAKSQAFPDWSRLRLTCGR